MDRDTGSSTTLVTPVHLRVSGSLPLDVEPDLVQPRLLLGDLVHGRVSRLVSRLKESQPALLANILHFAHVAGSGWLDREFLSFEANRNV